MNLAERNHSNNRVSPVASAGFHATSRLAGSAMDCGNDRASGIIPAVIDAQLLLDEEES